MYKRQDHPTGIHLLVTAGLGLSVSAVFEVTQHHQGAPGIAHGWLLSLALDETLGATNWLIRVSGVTAHLEVSYRLPVPVGAQVFVTANIEAVRGRKVWATAVGRLNSQEGPIALHAGSLFIQVPIEHFTKHGRAEDIETAAQDSHVINHVANLDYAP